MIALLDTPQNIEQCQAELGGPVGQLLTPLTRRTLRHVVFGIDNGAFARFQEPRFLALLDRERERRDKCLFVAAPAVRSPAIPCDRRRQLDGCFSLSVFLFLFPRIHALTGDSK